MDCCTSNGAPKKSLIPGYVAPEFELEFPWRFGLPKFEECLQRLEQIVEQLERGDLPLEQSLKLFEEGMNLSNACRKELEEAEGKVEILLKQNGKMRAEPFESSADRPEARK
jgi:exodeoxyribonuclease VII small subunit